MTARTDDSEAETALLSFVVAEHPHVASPATAQGIDALADSDDDDDTTAALLGRAPAKRASGKPRPTRPQPSFQDLAAASGRRAGDESKHCKHLRGFSMSGIVHLAIRVNTFQAADMIS